MRAPDGPVVEFRVLGPFELLRDGEPLPAGGPKQRALLAALVMSANHAVSVDRLIEELWGDEPPSRAMGSLQAYISRLRRLLQPAGGNRRRSDMLVTQPPGYLLRVDPDAIDAARFERAVSTGARALGVGDATSALRALEGALALWRGHPYADFGFEEFAQAEISRLTELHAAAVEARLVALLETGDLAAVVAEAEAAVRGYPLREGVWTSLILALYRSGRPGEALRAYQRARHAVAEELGIEPSRTFQELEEQILQRAPDLDGPAARSVPVAAAEPSRTIARPPPQPREPLVGRAEELGRLLDAVTATLGGSGRAALVHGEPGIGKSRLTAEAVERAAEAGAVLGYGRCVEGDVRAAYWPWTNALRRLLEQVDPATIPLPLREGLAELSHLDPALARWAGGLVSPPPPTDPDLARSRLHRAAVDVLFGLAALRPVVVVLEDVQWADPASLHLLSLMGADLARGPVLVVVTYRDQEADPALLATLAALARLDGSADIPLGGLDADAVHQVVELNAGQGVSEAVAAAIAERTAGNPLFVAELTRLLRSERALVEEAVRAAPVPIGVRDVIRRRLDRLPAQTATVLTVAAVIGRRFPLRLLESVTQLAEDELLDRVEAAVAIGLAVEVEGQVGTFSFTHDLVRDTLQDAVSGTRRARLHARVGHALLEQPRDDPTWPFEVAHHLLQALPLVPPEDVADRVLAAADIAARHLAFEQAEQLLRRALTLLELLPADRRAPFELAVRARLARVLTLTAGHASPQEREHAARAVELAADAEPSPDAVLALWGAAVSAGMAAEFATTLAIGDELLTSGDDGQDRTLRYLGHALLGGCCWYLGELATSSRHLRETIEILDAGGLDPSLFCDRTNGAWSRAAHALVACLGGQDDEASVLMADAMRRAQQPGQAFALVFTLLFDALLAVFRRDWAHVRRRADEVVERADAIGYRQFAAMGHMLVAALEEGSAAWDERSEASPEVARPRLFQPLFHAVRAQTLIDAGRHQEAGSLLAEALTLSTATGERFYEPEIHRLLAVAALQDGRAHEASAHIDDGLRVARQLGTVVLHERLSATRIA